MTPRKSKERKARAKKLITQLNKMYPKAKLALEYKTDWELLVAVQLSAQSTDKKVNEITPKFFKKFKTIKAVSKADLKDIQNEVSSVLYYKNKGKNIKNAAIKILEDFEGKLPKTMEEMLTIPGVARKTANVLLGNLFKVYEGIVVDTHMIRFARRFDLTDHKDAVKIERDLMEVIDKKDWFKFAYKVVDYGRNEGNPRGKRELHENDSLTRIYPKAKNYWPK